MKKFIKKIMAIATVGVLSVACFQVVVQQHQLEAKVQQRLQHQEVMKLLHLMQLRQRVNFL